MNESQEQTLQRKRKDAASKMEKIANASQEETLQRKRTEATRKMEKRANESQEQTLQRKRKEAASKMEKKANESQEETLRIKSKEATRKMEKRANKNQGQTLQRKRKNTARMKSQRMSARCNAKHMDIVVKKFHSQIKVGPVYVCTVCHRLMYKESVVKVQVSRYKKSSELLKKVFAVKFHIKSFNKQGWICKTCDSALLKGKMPIQAKANELSLDKVPQELSNLNSLELRLISMRIPFMKMIALPRGQQRYIHGPAVNIPANLSSVCDLPRLPSESQLIPMKLKRKLKYKGYYMYEYVCPAKLHTALQWLKSQNNLYANTAVNPNWEEQSQEDNLILFSALMQQDCSEEFENICEISMKSSKDVEPKSSEDSSEIALGYQLLNDLVKERGFIIKDVPADGDCLFSAVSVQLESIAFQ